jgi:hypothetical protein
MKIIRYILLIIVSIIPLISKSQEYCDFIQKIQDYQDSVKLKPNGDSDILDSNTFDINTYLSFFDKIELEKGFRINVYFFDNFLDGNPYLYALKENEKIADKNKRALYKALNKPDFRAKNHVNPKDSEIGFLQYLFFSEMGEQFALKWHANYNEKRIICSSDMINRFIKEHTNNEMFSVDSISLEKLKLYHPEPNVKFNNNYCEITWIENRTHSGLFKCTYHIDRKAPFKITRINDDKLLDININFLY